MKRTAKGRRAAVLLVLPGIFLTLAVSDAFTDRSPRIQSAGWFPQQPIPGEASSLDVAESRVDLPIPLLPGTQLVDPCDGSAEELDLRRVWVSPTNVEEGHRKVGLSYSLGVWVSVQPLTLYDTDTQSAGELLPVEVAFSKEDYPDGLATARVGEHVAWVKDLPEGFSCSDVAVTPVAPIDVSPGAPAPIPTGEAVMFNPTEISSVTWAENGVVVNIAGPIPASDLIRVAESARWAG